MSDLLSYTGIPRGIFIQNRLDLEGESIPVGICRIAGFLRLEDRYQEFKTRILSRGISSDDISLVSALRTASEDELPIKIIGRRTSITRSSNQLYVDKFIFPRLGREYEHSHGERGTHSFKLSLLE